MPKYEPVNYRTICSMVLRVVQMKGQPMLLRDLVSDMSRNLNLGIDTKRVFDGLGSKVVEKVEEIPVYGLDGNQECVICRVTTWVIP
jgi:hypothetical protein